MSRWPIVYMSLALGLMLCGISWADDSGKQVVKETVRGEWPDGTPKMVHVTYSDGTSKLTRYRKDGTVSTEHNMDAALRQHGLFRQWHPNGQLAKEGHFEHGKRSGTWTSWLDTGEPVSRTVYEEDEMVESWHWSRLSRTWHPVKR